MKLLRASRKVFSSKTEDMIVFAVNEVRFAIAASAVVEIRNLDGLIPHSTPDPSAKVRYTLVREDKGRENSSTDSLKRKHSEHLYFVVEGCAHFGLPATRAGHVLLLRDCATAVLVDGIERMMQVSHITALPLAFTGEERSWYRGLAVVDGKVIPVVNPDSFLSKAEVTALQSGFLAATAASGKAKGAANA